MVVALAVLKSIASPKTLAAFIRTSETIVIGTAVVAVGLGITAEEASKLLRTGK